MYVCLKWSTRLPLTFAYGPLPDKRRETTRSSIIQIYATATVRCAIRCIVPLSCAVSNTTTTPHPDLMQKQQKKESKNKTAKKAVKASVGKQQYENFFKLGECTHKYGLSLANPFTGPAGACMPVSPSLMTRKVRSFCRGTMAVGTGGFGYVLANGRGMKNDVHGAYFSSSAFTGITMAAAGTGVNGADANADTGSGDFSANTTQGRLVSFGVRVRYRGTELNRGGRYLTLEEPDHGNMADYAASDLLAEEKCNEHAVGSDWVQVCLSGPVAPADYDFTTCTDINVANNYLAVAVESTPGNLFDFEVFWNYELVGAPVRGKTYSEADDAGVGAVIGTIRSHNNSGLDSKHPIIKASGFGGTNLTNTSKVLQQTVNAYTAKNTSGWITKGVKLWNEATPYLKKGFEIAETLAPMFLL